MKPGDTFRPADPSVDIHLWVIISDPDQDPNRVLIVSLTTFKPKKESVCLLHPGDHPFIRHPTCVAYNLANAPSLAQLEGARASGRLIPDIPVSEAVLRRIREGAALSTKLPIEYGELLDAQGLI
ncbi:hypothetical protein P12x_005897 [Tundrisphaera lichenicola]|uniref:hypothetical protein n=1 Tax=Tundrisphaera lichenicola TaxID=2029860 RepID=UPI003EC04909